jgi:hypothetical protein
MERTSAAVQGPITSGFWALLNMNSTDLAAQQSLLIAIASVRRALRGQVWLAVTA